MIKDKRKRIVVRIVLIIIGVISIICLSGCSNKKCVKSHKENSTCVHYLYSRVGSASIIIPQYYECQKTICDEWAEENE